MTKRLLAALAIVACAAAVVLAQEQATFILNNGARETGAVVFHGGHGYNMIDDNLNLRIGSNERSFAVGDVSVIDFVGGTPPDRELQAVPASGHLMALRNGALEVGRFVNIVNGKIVRWQNQDGSSVDKSIGEVSRIYLNQQGARIAYNYAGAMGQPGTPGRVETPLAPGAVAVQANMAWTPTPLTVKKGDRVAFQTTGQIAFGQGADQIAGSDGSGSPAGAGYPVPVMPIGGLIARVGNSAPFPIGSNNQPIVMPADGQLMLGVNDNQPGDNSGFFSVVVTKTR